ncbi:dihydrolipoamide acetyltransferase family protein [Pseudomonadota bacterium]
MAYEFKFPDVGEGIHEGKLVKWSVKEGDEVAADDPVAEVETDKAVVEIPSPVGGKVLGLNFKEGDTIKVGEVLMTIEGEASEEAAEAAPEPAAKEAPKEKSGGAPVSGVVGSLEEASEGVLAAPSLAQSGAVFEKDAKPEVEKGTAEPKPVAKAAAEAAAPEAKAEGGGLNVPKAGMKAVKKYDMFGYIDRIAYSGARKAVGEHMEKSMTEIPHVTHTDNADVTDLWDLRNKEKVAAEKDGIKLTFLAYIIKAAIEGLKEHPTLNAMLEKEEGQIIVRKYFNIGVAVDTEAGLMVPVIKGADKKSLLDIAKELQELAEKARDRKINPMDLKGGSFTITNVGSAGGIYFTPVINFPQSAILGIGMITEQAAVINGKVVPRRILPLSVSFDHRVLDGAEAARFTKTVKDKLEDPKSLK